MADWPETFDALLRRHCRFVPGSQVIDPDALLTSLGVVDSIQVIELIADIDDSLRITIPLTMLTPEAFASPRSLWRMLSALSQDNGSRS